ncbi:MAG: cupin-like domain-containing protein [Thalassotalea sp.]
MRALKQVAIWHDVTPTMFQTEIAPLSEPAILKDLVGDWPIIKNCADSDSLLTYLAKSYVGGNVPMAELAPEGDGRFFYNQDMSGFSFTRKVVSYEHFISKLTQYRAEPSAPISSSNSATISAEFNPAVAIQSAPIGDYFPPFESEQAMALFAGEVTPPRFWLGNKSTVVAHYDDAENIACVVAGKRRVTLFPPEQIQNLYVGPLQFTPAGAPVSMVNLHQPDFEKFPHFKQALNFALVADLEPGDALYIPTLWWHHVEALSEINMLVNYWSGGSISQQNNPVPMDALLLAMLTIRDLPPAQNKAWQSFFQHYVFQQDGDKFAHIPAQIKGILQPLSLAQQQAIKKWLVSQLS